MRGVIALIDARAADAPHAVCLSMGGDHLTYGELRDASQRAARTLQSCGLEPGDRVAILSRNDPAVLVAILGILRAGCVYVPLNLRDPLDERAEILRRLRCRAIVHHPDLTTDVDSLIDDQTSVLRYELRRSELEASPDQPAVAAPHQIEGSIRPDDPAAIFTTGGTTGRPKGVLFSQRALAAVVEGAGEIIDSPGLVLLTVMPLTHAAGRLALAALGRGGRVVVLPSFDPARTLDAIETERVTAVALAPTMLYMLLDDPSVRGRDYSSLRRLSIGAAPVSLARLKEAIEVFGPVVGQGYGQTEAPLLIANMPPSDYAKDGQLAADSRLRSCGRPTRYADVRIRNEVGADLECNEVGEIVVRGDFVMDGYVDLDEAADPPTTTPDGYHRTGDLGFLDDDGYLTIVGRARDMIISGGFNVYPAQVEDALAHFPGVAEVCVVGIPDDRWGERVVAIVQPQPERLLDPEAIARFARSRLGLVKAPRQIEIVPELPRNHNGKILKDAVRAHLTGSR